MNSHYLHQSHYSEMQANSPRSPPSAGPYHRNGSMNGLMFNSTAHHQMAHAPHHQMPPIHHPHHHMQMQNDGGGYLCAGCGKKIVERHLLQTAATDQYWHHSCLRCHLCGRTLADIGDVYYVRDNMTLCKSDYAGRYGSAGTCSSCHQKIPPNEMVMRANNGGWQNKSGGSPSDPSQVFHVHCFACNKCRTRLMPGDRYYMAAGNLFCEADYKLMKGNVATMAQPQARKGKVGRPRRSRLEDAP